MVIDLKDVFKKMGGRMDNKTFLRNSFYFTNGIFLGVGINEVLYRFNLLGSGQNLTTLNGSDTGVHKDFVWQLILASAIIGSEYFFKVRGAASLGVGMILGSKWADSSEKGGPLTAIGI